MSDAKFVVSSSPHTHAELDTQKIMAWVLIALAPAGLHGIYVYGIRSAAVMAVCVASCVFFEWLWQKSTGRDVTIGDLSAAVTGLMLAYNLPVTIPYWMAVVGSAFSIIVVKQFYGGIGCNILNPALAGRAFMLASWPVAMTHWSLDGITSATPLAILKENAGAALPSMTELLLGHVGGCIGEACPIALLIGFAILLWKDIIKWHIPVVYILATGLFCFAFGSPAPVVDMLSGGLFLGAIFMATDYTTTPVTRKGQVIFALGCAFITSAIRKWGAYPEGVSYSILIMDLMVPLIDRAFVPHIFGQAKGAKKNA